MVNPRQLVGRAGFGSVHVAPVLASKLVQVEPTLSTFHLLMSWLKVLAPLNMSAMVVTELVSQLPMFPLKLAASLNMPLISVTPLVHDLASSASLEAA